MNRLVQRLSSQRLQYVLGAVMVPLLLFLLVQSSQTGRARYEAAEDALARIEALDLELNAVLFPLMFEIQTSLDDLTRVQTELYDAAADYEALRGGNSPTVLYERIQEKLQFVDDVKAQQAVMRNSRAIAQQMLEEAIARPALDGTSTKDALYEVEGAFLDFVGRRDPPSIATVRERIAEAQRGVPVLEEFPEWGTFVAHAETLIDYTETNLTLMFELFGVPLPQQIAAELDAIEAWFAARSESASRYRYGMFAVALLLLAFSAYKAVQARRYYRMLERANVDLEHRVAERTSELSEANAALEAEIHERAAVESQLRIAQKLEAIGQLAAGIAHEINTPTQYASDNVAFVSSAWQDLGPVLEDYERRIKDGEPGDRNGLALWKRADVDYLREEIPVALNAAADGLGQIGRIVRAIRDFSHPGDDSLRPENLNRAVENAVTVAVNEWKYVAEVTLDLDTELPPVPCNVSAFNQVILNLIVNSAQAIQSRPSPDGRFGEIRISTRLAGEYAEILVEDNGPGVPEDIRHRIFDPFFTTKEVGKGTGQGLAIAFRVVTKQHGGTLSVAAAAGERGARFTIRLPIEEPAHEVGRDDEVTDTIRKLEALAVTGHEPSYKAG